MMEPKQLFKVDPKTVGDFLSESNVGFYVPAYQRPYAWHPSDDVEPFFRTVTEPLFYPDDDTEQLPVTFIGTIIVFSDSSYQTVKPHVQGHLPAKVLHVIDGQQRITTLLLLAKALHTEVFKYKKAIAKLSKKQKDSNENYKALAEQLDELDGNLFDVLFVEKKKKSVDGFGLYPKMIRQLDDCWSYQRQSAQYESALSSLLHKYALSILNADKSVDESDPEVAANDQDVESDTENGSGLATSNSDAMQAVLAAEKKIARKLKELLEAKLEEVNKDRCLYLPEGEGCANNWRKLVLDRLISHTDLRIFFRDVLAVPGKHDLKLVSAARLILVGRYLLTQVAVIQVDCSTEGYAFDIFESLNTTGEPLTAIETFKPLVVKREEGDGFQDSDAHQWFSDIEKLLAPSKRRRDWSADIVTAFALSWGGYKLPKKLRDQRARLQQSYDDWCKSCRAEERADFIRRLYYCAKVLADFKLLRNSLMTSSLSLADITLSDDASTCLRFLERAGHNITIGVIATFVDVAVTSLAEKHKQSAFVSDAVCAVAAFFAILRSSRRGTARIDDLYRDLMRKFSPSPHVSADAWSIDELRSQLRNLLQSPKSYPAITSQEQWLTYLQTTPVYDESQPVAKFLLALGLDSAATPSAGAASIPKPGATLHLFRQQIWEQSWEVEHICPLKAKEGWDTTLRESQDSSLLNRLGNLTLLEKSVNISLSNHSQATKWESFRKLCEPDQIVAPSGTLSAAQNQTVASAQYAPWLLPLTRVESWNAHQLDLRTKALGMVAWQRLSAWLGFV
jgi:hypothetical protein